MLVIYILVALVVIALVFRRPTLQFIPARLTPGDAVISTDGMRGRVVEIDGRYALIAVGERRVWIVTNCLGIDEQPPAMDNHLYRDIDDDTDQPRVGRVNRPATGRSFKSPAPLAGFGDAFERLGERLYDKAGYVVFAWLVIFAIALPLAGNAHKVLEPGGFSVRGSEVMSVVDKVGTIFHQPRSNITIIVPGTIASTKANVDKTRAKLLKLPGGNVVKVDAAIASHDGKSVAIKVYLRDIEQKSVLTVGEVRTAFATTGGFPLKSIELAGTAASAADTTDQAQADLAKAEIFGIPAALLVLLLVFRSLVAALLPVVVGAMSVIIGLGVLDLIGHVTVLSIFVVNIASMLGFGLGIDYSLLCVSRFREELDRGNTVRKSVVMTTASAGRALVVSGVVVMVGMASLAAIPMGVMLSIAIGGVVIVTASVCAASTLLPAMLSLLGPRINMLSLRAAKKIEPTDSRWYHFAKAVMKRPALSIFLGGLVLVSLIMPLAHAHVDIAHDEVLPYKSPSRVAERHLKAQFDQRVIAPMVIIAHGATPAQLTKLQAQLAAVPHVTKVDVLGTNPLTGDSLIDVMGDPSIARGGVQGRATVGVVHVLDTPVPIEVGGVAAAEREFLAALKESTPRTLLLVYLLSFIVLGVGFRSITLPLKAIVLDSLSILASFGVLVLVFQDGHGIEFLGAAALGYTDSTLPVMLFCILYSLSMDYEVFMLAKVTEGYQQGLDVEEATARGVASTAPLITGAALILIVIGISFALTGLVLIKEIGFGMAVALAIDATVVRFVLLPALMKYLGELNWWMPRWLAARVPRLEWAH